MGGYLFKYLSSFPKKVSAVHETDRFGLDDDTLTLFTWSRIQDVPQSGFRLSPTVKVRLRCRGQITIETWYDNEALAWTSRQDRRVSSSSFGYDLCRGLTPSMAYGLKARHVHHVPNWSARTQASCLLELSGLVTAEARVPVRHGVLSTRSDRPMCNSACQMNPQALRLTLYILTGLRQL